MVLQSELTGSRLAQVIESLVHDSERVRAMAVKSLGLRKVDSTTVTVDECEQLVLGN